MPTDDAAHASNWRTVLLVDFLLAAAVTAGGLAVLLAKSALIGAFVAAAGLAYAVLIVRRGLRWARLRREAGT
jgi:hypothetical protein